MRYCLLWAFLAAVPLGALSAQPVKDTRLYATAEQWHSAYVEDLERFSNMDSGTSDMAGLASVEQLISAQLKQLGAQVSTYPASPATSNIVVGEFQGHGDKNIMLMIHYDTVFQKGDTQKRPFSVEGNIAHGLGVADAKGGVLLILYIAKILQQSKFDEYKTLTLLFNPDEEIGSPGSNRIFSDIARHQDYIFIYEPPKGDSVTVGTRGVARLELKVLGRTAHAGANPEEGRNAAVELVNQIGNLQALGSAAKDTSVNWTVLNAGSRFNVIPDRATATADVRVYDTSEFARVQKDADAAIAHKAIEQTQVDIAVVPVVPPLARNRNTDCLAANARQIYQELGRNLDYSVMRYGTDAGFMYTGAEGAPVILDGMGISGANLHSLDEWADLDTVVPRIYLGVRLIEELTRPTPKRVCEV
ncbi:glutamate carboxypeptidase [Pseudomonas sp. RIT-To-2]|uniref:glutamate carboxypeptidase n=1 Tax=Pseudomonas sp. RIT-To-2 TaxID=3462541 RepID=UPI00241334D7